MKKSQKTASLEASINEITQLIEKMEQGELSLEQSLTYFERGINLIKHSQKILSEAEQKVEILLKKQDKDTLHPYQPDDDAN